MAFSFLRLGVEMSHASLAGSIWFKFGVHISQRVLNTLVKLFFVKYAYIFFEGTPVKSLKVIFDLELALRV